MHFPMTVDKFPNEFFIVIHFMPISARHTTAPRSYHFKWLTITLEYRFATAAYFAVMPLTQYND